MGTNMPTGLDSLTNPSSGNFMNSPSHSAQHDNANDAIEAMERILVGPSVILTEIANPGVTAANGARIYARDNGSGKTQLVVVFESGAVQVLATEP